MLISHSKKFIFVHTYKVAGSSIRDALSPFCYPSFFEKVLKKLGLFPKIQSSNFPHHIKVSELKDLLPEKMFNNYFKFAFVRNPWDWQVSLYHFTRQNPEHFQHELVRKMNFEEYINWRVNEAMCFQSGYTHDKHGEKLVDFIGKFENLDNDFKTICDKLGIDKSLKALNISKHDDYMKYYTTKTYDMINQAYKKEIELFDYKD